MSRNIDVIRGIYDAAKTGDLASVLQVVAPDAITREAPSLPYGGEFQGPDGMGRLLKQVFSTWAKFEFELKELIDGGETIVALLQARITQRGADQATEMPMVEIWRLRDGKVVELVPYYWDTAQLVPKA
jgi:hypothetical protein